MGYKVSKSHDISSGHRVVNHESKCRFLHGHTYRLTMTCEANELDSIGRVIDIEYINERICQWLDDNWDHKFLVWEEDYLIKELLENTRRDLFVQSLVFLPFNPTPENLAEYLVTVIGPRQLKGTGARLTEVVIEETSMCRAAYSI